MEKNGLGPRLRRKRLALLTTDRRYSLRRIAAAVGMQPSHLSRIERGDSVSLSEEKLVALARELGECPDEILALSGKVASDVLDVIRAEPGRFANLIRRRRDAAEAVDGAPFSDCEGALARLERRFSESQRLARIGSWDQDLATGATSWSDELFRLFGYEPGSVEPSWDFFWGQVHPGDRRILSQVREAALAGPGEVEYRFRFLRRDGRERLAQARAQAFFGPDGGARHFSGTLRDVTEHLAATRQARDLARLPQESPHPVLRARHDGSVEYANPAAQALWGIDGRGITAPEHAGLLRLVRQALEEEEGRESELHYPPRSFHCTVVPCPERQCANVYGMDISRRVQAEQALRQTHGELEQRVLERTRELADVNRQLSDRLDEVQAMEKALRLSEERYRAVLEDQTEVICRFRLDGAVLFANAPYCRLVGRSLEELRRGSWRPVPHPEDMAHIERQLSALTPEQPVAVVENRVIDGTGQVRFMQFVNRGVFDAGGRLTEIQSVGRDISDRRAAELALAASEHKYRGLVSSLAVGIITATGDGLVDLANDKALEILGISQADILGRSLVTPPFSLCREDGSPMLPGESPLALALANHEASRDVTVGVRQDGWESIRWVSLSVFAERDGGSALSRVVVTLTDISDRRRLEAELVEGRERFRFLYRHFPQPTCVFRLVEGDFVLAEANRAALTAGRGRLEGLFGHRAGEILAEIPEAYLSLWTAFEGRQSVRRRMTLRFPLEPPTPHEVSFVFVPPDMVLVHAAPLSPGCPEAGAGPAA